MLYLTLCNTKRKVKGKVRIKDWRKLYFRIILTTHWKKSQFLALILINDPSIMPILIKVSFGINRNSSACTLNSHINLVLNLSLLSSFCKKCLLIQLLIPNYLTLDKFINLFLIYFIIASQSNNQIQIMLTAQQLQKYSTALFTQLHGSDTYEHLKALLYAWRDDNKSAPQAITTFLKILQLISQQTPELLEDLNRCLVKDYTPSDASPPSLTKVKRLAIENPNAGAILDSVLAWLRAEQPVAINPAAPKIPQLEQLSEKQFTQRLQKHEKCRSISKIIYLYRRCILTVGQFKRLLQPIYLSDPSFFNMLFQYAEELESRRRKVTIFAPLNELVDQKYPLEQVGNSYIIIPDGYANWGHSWSKNPLENVFNRSCVSVPLGTEGNFLITRKNQFEEQLLRNEEQKYEIDSNLACLNAAIKIIEKYKRITHPLVQRILSNIYSGEVLSIMMRNPHPQVARTIVIPRLRQKLTELTRCRLKFQKICEEVAGKNFYKSLDYRCFYFCKNDKKFNCPARWQKQIDMRKSEIGQEQARQNSVLQIQDRESLQHSRYYVLNSFDNITTQQLIPEKKVELGDRRIQAVYPRFPHNQVLFLVDFSDKELLNDVLQIILYHTQKKSLLELLIFKMMKLSIDRKLRKDSGLLQFIEGRTVENEIGGEPLNELKSHRRVYKDLNDQFLELIEEDIEPAQVQTMDFPFEGPENHTFIGTKQCYLFLRYLVTIYQRFARAKTLSDQRGVKGQQPVLYNQFLGVLVHKIKQQKGLEQYLRRIFQQDAFIFFTIDKLILGLTKLINNISVDSLTYKVLKEGVKDYDLEIRRWEDYQYPSVTEQLARLYQQTEILFRFTYSNNNNLIYVSAWENGAAFDAYKKKKEGHDHSVEKHILPFLNSPVSIIKPKLNRKSKLSYQNEYLQDDSGNLVMIGEQRMFGKRRANGDIREWQLQARKLKRLKLL